LKIKGSLKWFNMFIIIILGRTKSLCKPLLFLVYKDVSQDSCWIILTYVFTT
jgi:hypothetical protein